MVARRVLGLSKVVAGKDRRKTLEALRDYLAQQLETSPMSYKAGLARELRETLAAIEALPKQGQKSPADELQAKRDTAARRRAGSARKSRTEGVSD